jgi:hypothetical protein
VSTIKRLILVEHTTPVQASAKTFGAKSAINTANASGWTKRRDMTPPLKIQNISGLRKNKICGGRRSGRLDLRFRDRG